MLDPDWLVTYGFTSNAFAYAVGSFVPMSRASVGAMLRISISPRLTPCRKTSPPAMKT